MILKVPNVLKAVLPACAFVALMASGLSVSAAEPVDKAIVDKVRSTLGPLLGAEVVNVESSELPGIYAVEFRSGPRMSTVYSNADGSYFLFGDLYEAGEQGYVNLTEQRRDKERLRMLAAVDKKDMIVFAAEGETRGYINVFTDITCFYCQKLHLEVAELNRQGVEVRYLAYPRAGIGSPGYQQLVTAWCSDDSQGALTKLKAKQFVKAQSCQPNPVASQFELGQNLGVTGTPAIVTATGQLLPGYLPASDLIAKLGL